MKHWFLQLSRAAAETHSLLLACSSHRNQAVIIFISLSLTSSTLLCRNFMNFMDICILWINFHDRLDSKIYLKGIKWHDGGPRKSLLLELYSDIRISTWEEKDSVVDQEMVETWQNLEVSMWFFHWCPPKCWLPGHTNGLSRRICSVFKVQTSEYSVKNVTESTLHSHYKKDRVTKQQQMDLKLMLLSWCGNIAEPTSMEKHFHGDRKDVEDSGLNSLGGTRRH